MKYAKISAAVLSCALLLTGCGKTAEKASVDPSKTVMTIGNENVSAGMFGFYYNSYKRQSGDEEQAKEMAIEQCKDNFLLVAVAKTKGIEFDDEKQKEIADYKKEVVDSYDGGYDDFLEENNLNDSDVDAVISVTYYAEELKKLVDDSEFTDEEKREYFRNNYRRAKHILISTKDSATQADLSEDEQEKAKALAEELYERAKSGEDFDSLIKEYSEDPGSASNPDGYVFTDDEMVSEFQDGVDSIGMGEFTLVKSTYGYHIIQRLPLDETPEYFEKIYSENAENLDTKMDNKRFEDQVYAWADEYGIETVIDDEAIEEVTA